MPTPEHVLDSPSLTPKVWEELFDIYERHFASEFPFLHRTRFMKALHQEPTLRSTDMKKDPKALPRPAHDPSVLLGFLTLTARYHPTLLSNWGQKTSVCSNFLADATERSLGAIPGKGSTERAQALLFLGFHRWADLKGENGWYLIGLAGRYVQNLGFQKDEDQKETPVSDYHDDSKEQETFIDREIQRRTFWSCFVLDRYTSCMKKRAQLFNIKDINTQLPCSDAAFNHGQPVKTRLLKEDEAEYEKRRDKLRRDREHDKIFDNNDHPSKGQHDIEWEIGKEESELSLFIQAVDNFGRILAWSNASGRRQEELDPWDKKSTFFELAMKNKTLKEALPKQLALTTRNTDTHIYSKPSKCYVTIHALLTLSTIALYREYLAFAPWLEKGPVGPIDEPKVQGKPPYKDYWVDQARNCFGACKDFADLLQACRKADKFVESPITGWTTYIVAWCALYCHFFPKMDPDRALSSRPQASVWELANDIIWDMSERYPMAGRYTDFLARLRAYFYNSKAKVKAYHHSPGSMSSEELDGGGLKDYSTQFESEQKEFGSLNDEHWTRKTERGDLQLNIDHESEDQSEATSPTHFKHEDTPASTPASVSGFNAINNERKSTSEAPSLPPQSHAWAYAPSPSAAPIRSNGMYDPSNDYSEAHSMRPPTVDTAAISPAYNRGPGSYNSAPPATGHADRDQYLSRESGYVTTAPQMPWQQQQVLLQQHQQQGQQHNRLEFEQLKQQGQMSWRNDDLLNYQLGDGDSFSYDFASYMPGSVLDPAYINHGGEPYDGAGPATN